MRPRSVYEDGHDLIVDVPPYAVMIKFIGHYEIHVDMFCHYGTPLDFILPGNPLLFLLTPLVYVIGFYFR
jgi:hypothetical protein